MKKKTRIKKKYNKKEKNGLLKFVFLAGFIVLLGLALFLQSPQKPQTENIASETASDPSPLRRAITYYLPKKALQVGWFKIFRPSPTPTPTSPPPPTPTPCPGGIHTQSESKQSVAFVEIPASPPHIPGYYGPVEISSPPPPTPTTDPCF